MVLCGSSWCCVVPRGVVWFLVVLTSQGADHGEGGEGSRQALAAHDGRGVGGGEEAGHAEQTALENRPAR